MYSPFCYLITINHILLVGMVPPSGMNVTMHDTAN